MAGPYTTSKPNRFPIPKISTERQSYIFGGDAKAKTPEDAAHARAIADELMAGARPTSFGTGLDAIGRALVSKKYEGDAAAAEEAGRASADEAWRSILDGTGGQTEQEILAALENPWLNDTQKAVLSDKYTKLGTPPKREVINGKIVDMSDASVIADFSDKPETFRPLTEPEKASYGIPPEETGWQISDKTGKLNKEGGAGTNVTVNNAADPTSGASPDLLKKLGANEGEAWAGYLAQGTVAAGTIQDFEVLQKLMEVAPQDPLTGPLLQLFPGLDSAGAAFQSVIKRIAPTLRAPGSGATSDIEYAGFLQSLPSLSNRQDANVVIAAIMKNKAEINRLRGEAVEEFQNSAQTREDEVAARKKISELNRASLFTPQLREAMQALGIEITPATADDQAAQDAEIEALLHKYPGS